MFSECGEVITTASKEIVVRHGVDRSGVQSDTVQMDVTHQNRGAVSRYDCLCEVI